MSPEVSASSEPIPPRVLTPRKVKAPAHLPIIAVSLKDREVYVERQDLIFNLDSLSVLIQGEPPSLVVCEGADRMLRLLDKELSNNPHWQFKVSPNRVDMRNERTNAIYEVIRGTVVYTFGFRSAPAGERTKKPGTYHQSLDPDIFSRKGIAELVPNDSVRQVLALANWGDDVRDWIETQKLRYTPSQGGLAGQLLRDPRWFPDARRKVPRATNGRVRPTLPGNYYDLRCPEDETNNAYYLDMRASHHRIAQHLAFPHPDEFFARGDFRVTDDTDVTVSQGRPLARIGTPAYQRIMSEAKGILLVELSVPPIAPEHFPLPYLVKPGRKLAYVYTNELATIRHLGGVVDTIRAGWFSYTREWGMNRYARWALAQIDKAEPGRKLWLKPALLSTYGILAARPRLLEFGFRQAKSGVTKMYPAGSGMLTCTAHIGSARHETPNCNVTYRGMIEAEQRLRSLSLARYLTTLGSRVLAVYADSVFVDSSAALPLLPPEWRTQAELTRLQFYCPTAFTSAELTRLPGIPREARARHSNLLRMRAQSVRFAA